MSARAATPTVDGRLDDACWRSADWHDDFRRVKMNAELGPVRKRTAFAVVCDERHVYVAVRCFEKDVEKVRNHPDASLFGAENIELFLSPTGRDFTFYHFAVSPYSKDVVAGFYSEAGVTQPDPYAPVWQHAFGYEKDAWTVEFAFPLSAFYNTRNAEWSDTWRFNVARTMMDPYDFSTWSPLESKFHEPKNFRTLGGFPRRRADESMCVSALSARISGVGDGRYDGDLRIDVYAETAGDYELSVDAGETKTVRLSHGDNSVRMKCSYARTGRVPTRVSLRLLPDGPVCERGYPVMVDYEPIRVKLRTPGYRNNFYPGQNTDVVRGTVEVAPGVTAELVLEGPGFARQERKVVGKGSFEFDTRGFGKGEAGLTVKAGGHVRKVRIRNLPETGHEMTWIADGKLVANGRETLRRNMYADGFMFGRKMKEFFDVDRKTFAMTPAFDGCVWIVPEDLMKGVERKEAVNDVRPSPEYFARIDEEMVKRKDKDFAAWYICDEPECRRLSPIWLRHVYEYVAEKDPYHVVLIASRGGKAYTDCADWIETHPYLNAMNEPDGSRHYGLHPNQVGRFIDAFEASDRPDKVIGFLPTAFAYRWTSLACDYPTFDELVTHTWAAMIRGGKSLWPYAGHDLKDRPSVYEGVRYVFTSFAALENIVLNGTRTTSAKSADEEVVTYGLPDEKMVVAINFTATNRTVSLPAVKGDFREFRGDRRFSLDGTQTHASVVLGPLETLVATTKPHDAGLATLAETRAEVVRQEKERLSRDNQLLERTADIGFETSFQGNFNGGHYKLFDGMTYQLARFCAWQTNANVRLTFRNGLRPTFDRVRVHGSGLIGALRVSVLRDGVWRALTPCARRTEKYLCELSFPQPEAAEGILLEFPGPARSRNEIEIYEIEIPKLQTKGMCQ